MHAPAAAAAAAAAASATRFFIVLFIAETRDDLPPLSSFGCNFVQVVACGVFVGQRTAKSVCSPAVHCSQSSPRFRPAFICRHRRFHFIFSARGVSFLYTDHFRPYSI